MRYQTYFNLELFHSYYQDYICPDFTIEPTAACQRMLRGHRLVIKPNVNGVQVLVPLDASQQPVISLAPSEIFTFLLKLNNPTFVSFTQLDPLYRTSQSLYVFSNDMVADIVDDTFVSSEASELSSKLIQYTNLAQPVAEQSALDIRCAAIAHEYSSQQSTIFGMIEIHNNNSLSQDFSQISEFKVTFVAKQQVWRYYLVADKGASAEAFSIQDKEAEISFSPASIEPGDRILAAIQHRFPQSQPILLTSAVPVSCRKLGRPNLQLFKQGHTKPWIPHLPNPPNQHGTQVINVLEDV